jgi:RimJ/RimL family protein N-acetyltransferase
LAERFWGRGYATEAARAALEYGFGALGLDEIVSFTTVANDRSRRVMERPGMRHDPADDFDHPSLDVEDPIRPHVLYRLSRDELSAAGSSRSYAASPERGPSRSHRLPDTSRKTTTRP